MANKTKILAAAQKYAQKGQYDKAVKELQKLVEDDPQDVRTLLKIGDIHAKKGDRAEATKVYRQVAEFYSQQGFFLKAVAVYKQILKHDARDLEVTVKLAELYEHLGLQQEAVAQFQTVVTQLERAGQTDEALAMMRRMVELDPENVAARVRLAEAFSREKKVAEAVEQFAKAAELLKAQNRQSDYVKVVERLVFHDANRVDLVKELARIYMNRADTKRALAKLQIAFKVQPRDAETLTLMARAFQELGQSNKTVFVLRELAKLHRESGRGEDMRAAYRQLLELDPNDLEAQAAVGGPGAARPGFPGGPGGFGGPAPGTNPLMPAMGVRPGAATFPVGGAPVGFGGRPGTNPELAGFGPQRPGTNPELAGFGPQRPGTNPEMSGFGPQRPGTNPEMSGFGPQRPGTSPEMSGFGPPRPGTNPEMVGLRPPAPTTSGAMPSFGRPAPEGFGAPSDTNPQLGGLVRPTPPRPPPSLAVPPPVAPPPARATPRPGPIASSFAGGGGLRPPSADMQKLLTETDVYVKYGLRDKAIQHLKRLVDMDPTVVEAFAKMRDIYRASGDIPKAADAIVQIMRICAEANATGELEQARRELSALMPGHPMAQPGSRMASARGEEESDIEIDVADEFDMADAFDVDTGRPITNVVAEDDIVEDGAAHGATTDDLGIQRVAADDDDDDGVDLELGGAGPGTDRAAFHSPVEAEAGLSFDEAAELAALAGPGPAAPASPARGASSPPIVADLVSELPDESFDPFSDQLLDPFRGQFQTAPPPPPAKVELPPAKVAPPQPARAAPRLPPARLETPITPPPSFSESSGAREESPRGPRPRSAESSAPALGARRAPLPSAEDAPFVELTPAPGARAVVRPEPPPKVHAQPVAESDAIAALGLDQGAAPGDLDAGLFGDLGAELEGDAGADALLLEAGLEALAPDDAEDDLSSELLEEIENAEFLHAQGLLEESREAILEVLKRAPLNDRAVQLLDTVERGLGLRTGTSDAPDPEGGEGEDGELEMFADLGADDAIDSTPANGTFHGEAEDTSPVQLREKKNKISYL